LRTASNLRKDVLLGEPHGTANSRLRKLLLFKYVQLAGHDTCYRCGQKIERVDDFSVEHTHSWQSADDPRAVFFDLDRIAFSHLKCNVAAGARGTIVKQACSRGHAFDAANTYYHNGERECRICSRDRMRGYRAADRRYGRAA
jgi:hypothetical protein